MCLARGAYPPPRQRSCPLCSVLHFGIGELHAEGRPVFALGPRLRQTQGKKAFDKEEIPAFDNAITKKLNEIVTNLGACLKNRSSRAGTWRQASEPASKAASSRKFFPRKPTDTPLVAVPRLREQPRMAAATGFKQVLSLALILT